MINLIIWIKSFFNKEVKSEIQDVNNVNGITPEKSKIIVGEEFTVKVEEVNKDFKIYGWVIEKIYDGHFVTTHNSKIYHSKYSAQEALSIIYKSSGCEYVIAPIYRLNKSELRDVKINSLLTVEKQKQEIKSWKLNVDLNLENLPLGNHNRDMLNGLKRGTVFIRLENGNVIISGNNRNPTRYPFRLFRDVDNLLKLGVLDEVELKDEKWLYPHLIKELKSKL